MDQTVVNSPALPSLAAIARQFVGQRERPGNTGWLDADFEADMVRMGWKRGQAWCAYFVRLCVRLGIGLVDKTSPSAVTTYRNYLKAGLAGPEPRVDSIACWQHWKGGKATVFGHVAIVEKVDPVMRTMSCIEGNTDGSGGREGDGVYRKTRYTYPRPTANGLVLLGFCYPDGVKA